jgi:hypothetical protein
MCYHATIREGMWKYKQIVDSEFVRTCKVLCGSKESEIDSSECCRSQIPSRVVWITGACPRETHCKRPPTALALTMLRSATSSPRELQRDGNASFPQRLLEDKRE